MLTYIKNNIILSLAIFLSLISITGATIYHAFSLNIIGILANLGISIVLFIILLFRLKNKSQAQKNVPKDEKEEKQKSAYKNLILPALFLISLLSCFLILYQAATQEPIISPWQVIPGYYFIFYGLSALLLLLTLKQGVHKKSLLSISLFYFLSFSVALIVYKIQYGFDPFIHQATINLIDKIGSVEPKTFYYLGQYSLELLLMKLLPLPITLIDKFLVPLLAAIFLPYAFKKFLDNYFEDKQVNTLIVFSVMILTYSPFVLTTPQSLAYIFLILTIFNGLTCKNNQQLLITYIFSIAALSVHPIAGLPAIFFAILIHIHHFDSKKIKKYLYPPVLLFSSLSLPTAFIFLENKEIFNARKILSLDKLNLIHFSYPQSESIFLNFTYLYGFNLKLIYLIISLIGLFIAFKHRGKCQPLFISLLAGISALISYFLLLNLDYNFLISYERDNYPARLLYIAGLFFLPFFLVALYGLIEKIKKQEYVFRFSLGSLLILILSFSLYLSYPRFDGYYNSRGYSTSLYDLETVQWIENNATGNYIVLANQQVSAAALNEFGFSKYYNNNYFYPIPTSGPLYTIYLKMVYERASLDNMKEAMELAGVDESYLVLNDYWWALEKIINQAKQEAVLVKTIGNGKVLVFKYTK